MMEGESGRTRVGSAEEALPDEAPELTSSSPQRAGPQGEGTPSLVAELEAKLANAEKRLASTEGKLSHALAEQRERGEVSESDGGRDVVRSTRSTEGADMHGVGADEQVHTLKVTLKNLAGGFATRERVLTEELERTRSQLRGTQHVLGTLQETRLYAKETVKVPTSLHCASTIMNDASIASSLYSGVFMDVPATPPLHHHFTTPPLHPPVDDRAPGQRIDRAGGRS
jgi:hypothetical protein